MSKLQPPKIKTEDPGAKDIEESSDDHFSSASEGGSQPPQSPIPITRVERVDDKPAHGEVPGTSSYEMRMLDAVPDEIEVVPDGQRSRSGTRSRASSSFSLGQNAPQTLSEPPIPKTVVERVDDKPAHGEVEGTAARELRLADAEPDEVKKVPETNGRKSMPPVNDDERQAWFRNMWEGKEESTRQTSELPQDETPGEEGEAGEAGEAGEDFDDFAEEGDDDDFGDFDEAEADATPMAEEQSTYKALAPEVVDALPPLDWSSNAPTEEILAPYLDVIFPENRSTAPRSSQTETPPPSTFLSDRSLSLWQQLVSPPPMQPPNWTRSRIRRLFLVSLGVPVDLDEILPPSKQKRLVLPNINITTTPRASSVIERLRDGAINDSTTSLDSKTGTAKPSRSRRAPKGPAPPPEFDLNAATLLCGTTEEALQGYDDPELKDHIFTLEILTQKASSVLEYWLVRKDEDVKEKEALEGVIENLVGFVKGRRGK